MTSIFTRRLASRTSLAHRGLIWAVFSWSFGVSIFMTAMRQRSGSGRRGGMVSVENWRIENHEMFLQLKAKCQGGIWKRANWAHVQWTLLAVPLRRDCNYWKRPAQQKNQLDSINVCKAHWNCFILCYYYVLIFLLFHKKNICGTSLLFTTVFLYSMLTCCLQMSVLFAWK